MQIPQASLEGYSRNRLLTLAIRLIKKGEPLPVDLTARLLGHGVDVAALERNAA